MSKKIDHWLFTWHNFLPALLWLFLQRSQPDKLLCQWDSSAALLHTCVGLGGSGKKLTVCSGPVLLPLLTIWTTAYKWKTLLIYCILLKYFRGWGLCRSQQAHFFTGKLTETFKSIPTPDIKNESRHTYAGGIIHTRWITHHYVILDITLKTPSFQNTDLYLLARKVAWGCTNRELSSERHQQDTHVATQ